MVPTFRNGSDVRTILCSPGLRILSEPARSPAWEWTSTRVGEPGPGWLLEVTGGVVSGPGSGPSWSRRPSQEPRVRGVVPADFAWGALRRATCTSSLDAQGVCKPTSQALYTNGPHTVILHHVSSLRPSSSCPQSSTGRLQQRGSSFETF